MRLSVMKNIEQYNNNNKLLKNKKFKNKNKINKIFII